MVDTTKRYCVGDAMTMNIVTVSKDSDLKKCVESMKKNRIGSLIVVDSKKRPIGIITERDMVRKGMSDDLKPSEVIVEDIMVTTLFTITPEEDIQQALRVMRDHDIRHLPVINNDELVGFVTAKDLLSIQPDLFDLWVEHYTIREAERKPLRRL